MRKIIFLITILFQFLIPKMFSQKVYHGDICIVTENRMIKKKLEYNIFSYKVGDSLKAGIDYHVRSNPFKINEILQIDSIYFPNFKVISFCVNIVCKADHAYFRATDRITEDQKKHLKSKSGRHLIFELTEIILENIETKECIYLNDIELYHTKSIQN